MGTVWAFLGAEPKVQFCTVEHRNMDFQYTVLQSGVINILLNQLWTPFGPPLLPTIKGKEWYNA